MKRLGRSGSQTAGSERPGGSAPRLDADERLPGQRPQHEGGEVRAPVERDLPGTLRVVVTEREPVVLVQVRGSLQSADATGAVLPIDLSVRPLDMPVVASADSSLLAVLDGLRQNAPELYARVIQAKRSGIDELRFSVTGGAVGAAGPAMANTIIVRTLRDVTVARFKDILPVEADLARNHLRVVELDLRFRDQVIARQP